MHRIVGIFVLFITLFLSTINASASPVLMPAVSADAAILIDGSTGQILYEKNIHKKRPPASTTKIMTALLAIEGSLLEQKVTVSSKAASVGESSIHLQANEVITLQDLLYGALLHSGNDACVAIAEHVAGTEENFVSLMNHTAKKLGALNTNFCNTNGLPHAEHYSTAYDLAIITRYAMRNSNFYEIVKTRSASISGPENTRRTLSNTNQLLWSYNGADGVKTGTTNAAGPCLVSSAHKDGRHLIAVVLHSADRYQDTVKLLDYGFEAFEEAVVANKGEHFTVLNVVEGTSKTVSVVAAENLSVLVPKGQSGRFEQKLHLVRLLPAPVKAQSKVGRLTVLVNNQEIGGVDLITAQEIKRQSVPILIYQKLREQL